MLIPAHAQGSSREAYQIKKNEQTSMLYMIDRNVKSHTLLWQGHITLEEFIEWDACFAKLTSPEVKQTDEDHTPECIADFSIGKRKSPREYHVEFDNNEHAKIYHSFSQAFLLQAQINHNPFDICAMNGSGVDNSSIDIGMHDFRPFPTIISSFYEQTCIVNPLLPKEIDYVLEQTTILTS